MYTQLRNLLHTATRCYKLLRTATQIATRCFNTNNYFYNIY